MPRNSAPHAGTEYGVQYTTSSKPGVHARPRAPSASKVCHGQCPPGADAGIGSPRDIFEVMK